jgi:hypothetical protein
LDRLVATQAVQKTRNIISTSLSSLKNKLGNKKCITKYIFRRTNENAESFKWRQQAEALRNLPLEDVAWESAGDTPEKAAADNWQTTTDLTGHPVITYLSRLATSSQLTMTAPIRTRGQGQRGWVRRPARRTSDKVEDFTKVYIIDFN